MRSSSRILLSVFLITFVSAIPAPDKYKHFKSSGYPNIGATACLLVPYCKYHIERGDFFSAKYLNRRDGPESEKENLDFKPHIWCFIAIIAIIFHNNRAWCPLETNLSHGMRSIIMSHQPRGLQSDQETCCRRALRCYHRLRHWR